MAPTEQKDQSLLPRQPQTPFSHVKAPHLGCDSGRVTRAGAMDPGHTVVPTCCCRKKWAAAEAA